MNWKIICGDALEELRKLPDEHVQCVVTSPPYNLHGRKFSDSYRLSRGYGEKHNHWYDDAMPESDYQKQQRTVVEEALRVCDGSVFYNHKVRYGSARLGRVISPMEWLAGLPLWCEIIWDRCSGTAFNCKRFLACDERIYQFGKPKIWNEYHLTTVWHIPPAPQGIDHPCPFPIELAANCIRSTTNEGDLVMDPYCGAATTGVAALQLNRRFLGIELSPEYCEMARKRLANTMPLFQGGE